MSSPNSTRFTLIFSKQVLKFYKSTSHFVVLPERWAKSESESEIRCWSLWEIGFCYSRSHQEQKYRPKVIINGKYRICKTFAFCAIHITVKGAVIAKKSPQKVVDYLLSTDSWIKSPQLASHVCAAFSSTKEISPLSLSHSLWIAYICY